MADNYEKRIAGALGRLKYLIQEKGWEYPEACDEASAVYDVKYDDVQSAYDADQGGK